MYENFEWRPLRGPSPIAGLGSVPQFHEPSKSWYVNRLGAIYAYPLRPYLPGVPQPSSSVQTLCAQSIPQLQQIANDLQGGLAHAQVQPNVQAAYATLATSTYNALQRAQGVLAYLQTLPCR